MTAIAHPRARWLLLFVLACFVTTGCAAKKFRLVESGPPVQGGGAEGAVVVVLQVADARTDRDIDQLIERPVLEEVQALLQQELMATGRVSRVVLAPDSAAELVIEVELRQLAWEVPDYKHKMAMASAVGAVSGGLGALVYGSIPTDVHGHAVVGVTVKRTASGELLMARPFRAQVTDRRANMTSDTPGTKAEMVTRSVKKLLAEWRTEVAPLLEKEGR
jgi:hypothetical protein